jgi:transglutaminase-like putative cysteine protease
MTGKRLLFFTVLMLLGMTGGAASPGSSYEVECTYLARVSQLPRDAKTIRVWVPLAKSGREQRMLHRGVRAPVPYTITRDSRYGNDILHLAFQAPLPDRFEIAVDYRARLFGEEAPTAEPMPTPDELQRDLQPSGLVVIDGEVQAKAKEATAGRSTRVAKARGIYDYVRRFMTYDKTAPGWGRGDTRRACRVGKGNCTDFHSLFISMARAAEIPARFKIGVVIPQEPSKAIPGYHCWAEFYEEGQGWVPVDASEAWKHPERVDYYFGVRASNRFLISTGRDIELVPRQQGNPVNIFFSPYVEVDGQPFSNKVNVEVRLTDLQQGRAT